MSLKDKIGSAASKVVRGAGVLVIIFATLMPSSCGSTTASSHTISEPTCDVIQITSNCSYQGVSYAKYIKHSAIPEKSHYETTTSTDYCTRCNDGSYSPSCATGRGACSHHSGVAQRNAPRTHTSQHKVIDIPAKSEYTEREKK